MLGTRVIAIPHLIPSVRLHDNVTNTIQKLNPPTASLALMYASSTPYLIAHYVSCDKFSLQHQNFLIVIITDREPTSFSEAVKEER